MAEVRREQDSILSHSKERPNPFEVARVAARQTPEYRREFVGQIRTHLLEIDLETATDDDLLVAVVGLERIIDAWELSDCIMATPGAAEALIECLRGYNPDAPTSTLSE